MTARNVLVKDPTSTRCCFCCSLCKLANRARERRARRATQLLREGMPPGDVALEAGYFDQAHLTRALRQLIGLTPARVARAERQLSFLYKT